MQTTDAVTVWYRRFANVSFLLSPIFSPHYNSGIFKYSPLNPKVLYFFVWTDSLPS